MARVAVGDAIGSGFRLIVRKPVVVVVWGLAVFLCSLLPSALMMATMMSRVGDLRPGAVPTPETMASIIGLEFLNLPLMVLSFLMQVVLNAAIFRAVLEPQQGRFAYLRLGAQELWVGLIFLVFAILAGMAIFAVSLPVAGVIAAVGFGTRSAPATVIVGLVLGLGLLCAGVYVALRFSLALPMSFAERKFRLFESWSMTRGHVGALLLTALGVFGLMMLIEFALGIVLMALGVATVMTLRPGGAGWQQMFTQGSPMTALASLWPFALGAILVWSFITAAFSALATAPWAEIYRQLRPLDVEATFS